MSSNISNNRISQKQIIYYQFLDCLRSLAIIVVIIHHTGLRSMYLINDSVAQFLVRIGWIGVDVFFAISGYLITKILIKSDKKRDLRGFFIKRIFRIIPLYLVAVLVYFILGLIIEEKNIYLLWLNALFLTGWVIPFMDPNVIPYTITWSLSVEESAYVFFGLISLLNQKTFTFILIGLTLMSLILRWILVDTHIFQVQEVYYFPLTRIDSIAFGGLVALDVIKRKNNWFFIPLTLLLIALSYLWLYEIGQYNRNVAIFGYSIIAFSSALIVSIAITLKNSKNIFIRILTHVGKRSYFIYLFHVFVIGAVQLSIFSDLRVFLGFWGITTIVILTTIIMAEVSWRLFELPLIQLGRKIARPNNEQHEKA